MLQFRSTLNFRPAALIVVGGAAEGMQEAAEGVLVRSSQLVPVDSGTLRESGRAVSDGLVAAVTYTADYAVYVHERLDVYHPDGQAKFLENALDSSSVTSAATIAAAIRRRT